MYSSSLLRSPCCSSLSGFLPALRWNSSPSYFVAVSFCPPKNRPFILSIQASASCSVVNLTRTTPSGSSSNSTTCSTFPISEQPSSISSSMSLFAWGSSSSSRSVNTFFNTTVRIHFAFTLSSSQLFTLSFSCLSRLLMIFCSSSVSVRFLVLSSDVLLKTASSTLIELPLSWDPSAISMANETLSGLRYVTSALPVKLPASSWYSLTLCLVVSRSCATTPYFEKSTRSSSAEVSVGSEETYTLVLARGFSLGSSPLSAFCVLIGLLLVYLQVAVECCESHHEQLFYIPITHTLYTNTYIKNNNNNNNNNNYNDNHTDLIHLTHISHTSIDMRALQTHVEQNHTGIGPSLLRLEEHRLVGMALRALLI